MWSQKTVLGKSEIMWRNRLSHMAEVLSRYFCGVTEESRGHISNPSRHSSGYIWYKKCYTLTVFPALVVAVPFLCWDTLTHPWTNKTYTGVLRAKRGAALTKPKTELWQNRIILLKLKRNFKINDFWTWTNNYQFKPAHNSSVIQLLVA
jgi:hypothetical protein